MVSKFALPCLLGVISLFCAPAAKTATQKAPINTTANIAIKNEAVRDYSGEEEITNGNLVVSATASTLTSLGQSFSLTFSTGGQGWCDSTNTFLLAPEDSEFDDYFKKFSELTVEEREELTAQYERGEYEPVHFNSYVYSLNSTNTVKDIVIPRSLRISTCLISV